MSHTPGPWHRNIRGNGKYPVIFAGRNTHVAQAKGYGVLEGSEIESNIDLIAAAPEMYNQLTQLTELVQQLHDNQAIVPNVSDSDEYIGNALRQVRKVIAKAGGKYL